MQVPIVGNILLASGILARVMLCPDGLRLLVDKASMENGDIETHTGFMTEQPVISTKDIVQELKELREEGNGTQEKELDSGGNL